jgi:tocopherol cyclase
VVTTAPNNNNGSDNGSDNDGNCTPEQFSFAVIFHVFDPHLQQSKRRGVGMQVLLPNSSSSSAIALESADLYRFQAHPKVLDVRNLFRGGNFFALNATRARGRCSAVDDKDRSQRIVRFDFDIQPQIGWGGQLGRRQYSTAGWLAAFPMFDPHYQVLMSKGVVAGEDAFLELITDVQPNSDTTVERRRRVRHKLQGATVYLEKNWGTSFPSAWWWMQANTFPSGDLTVTCTGGRRRLPPLPQPLKQQQEEDVALVGLHYKGEFYPFPNVIWDVQWGTWNIGGRHEEYEVTLTGTCNADEGFPVLCPTVRGMEPIARETFSGDLRVRLYQRGSLLFDETVVQGACLEVGGLPWDVQRWRGESAKTDPIRSIIMNKQIDRFGADLLDNVDKFVKIPGL